MITKKHFVKFSLFVIILFANSVDAQMYVSPNTSVYVNNQEVYLANELELNASTSNFYLRRESQLLQGTASAGANKGLGKLSVFQEGTVNNYAYNYWCSPVGASIAAAGNSLFGITQLGVPTSTTVTVPTSILAMNNYDGISSVGALAIAPYWIWKFSVKINYADWISVGSTSTIAAGEGFTMKGVSGSDATAVDGVINNIGSNQRYDFRGKPNDGTIDIPVATNQFTLTGNPYPSAIDLSMFLTDAINTDGIAYFWESNKTVNSHYIASYVGGYGTFAPISRGGTGIYVSAAFWTFDGSGAYVAPIGGIPPPPGSGFERRFCPVGQGFMVQGVANGIVQMKNNYRVFVKEGKTNFSQFEKRKNPIKASNFLPEIISVSGFDYTTVSRLPVPQIRLITQMDKGMTLPMVLAFEPTATDAADFAMDAKSINGDLDQEIYFGINGASYTVDVIAFDYSKRIPIGFRNKVEATYKIKVDQIINFSGSENVYLHNKVSDVYYDIKKKSFDVTLPAGVNNKQYEITFKKFITLGIDDSIIKSLTVYQNNATKNMMINNPLQIDLASCNLYDMAGRLVFDKKKLGNNLNYEFPTSNLSDGIYIVNLFTKDKLQTSLKIIIKN